MLLTIRRRKDRAMVQITDRQELTTETQGSRLGEYMWDL